MTGKPTYWTLKACVTHWPHGVRGILDELRAGHIDFALEADLASDALVIALRDKWSPDPRYHKVLFATRKDLEDYPGHGWYTFVKVRVQEALNLSGLIPVVEMVPDFTLDELEQAQDMIEAMK